jgi:hypothetical protein
MPYIPTVFYPTNTPPDSGGTLYTVPSGKSIIVKNIVMTNTTNNEATVTLNVIPPSGVAQPSNRIVSELGIPPHGMSTLDCSIVLPTGAQLYGRNSTAAAVTVTVSGVEVS